MSFALGQPGTYRIREMKPLAGYKFDEGRAYAAEFTVEDTEAFQNATLELVEAVPSDVASAYRLRVDDALYKDGVANERAETPDPTPHDGKPLVRTDDPLASLAAFAVAIAGAVLCALACAMRARKDSHRRDSRS